jgi:hypothetical protein
MHGAMMTGDRFIEREEALRALVVPQHGKKWWAHQDSNLDGDRYGQPAGERQSTPLITAQHKENGGPTRTRTWNQTVMSGRL